MTQKQILFKIKGMQRDLSNSVFGKEYAFENMNIRINADTDNGLLSITNEKGTRKLSTYNDSWNLEVILGFAELDKCVVLFGKTAAGNDTIGKIEYDPDGEDEIRYTSFIQGDLSFSTEHPIETLVDIENENIQKVYWVDGINQPRVINIAGEIKANDNTQFDFVPPISGGYINVEHSETAGQFPAGVIQYAFTYFNKFGAESNVVDVSPIYYIADKDKGVAPNETVNKSFKVSFTGLDAKWEYIRLYSIIRTSINTTPEVRKVVDLKLTNNISYTDTGALGEYITPTDLLYKEGEVLAASTLASKDGTLFLGDINIKNTGIVNSDIKDIIENLEVTRSYKIVKIPQEEIPLYNGEYNSEETEGEYYQYKNSLYKSNSEITHYKANDYYRLGVQLQDKYGKWTDPIFIKDDKILEYPTTIGINDNYNIKDSITVEEAEEIRLTTDALNPLQDGDLFFISNDGELQGKSGKFEVSKGDLVSLMGSSNIYYNIGETSSILVGNYKYYLDIHPDDMTVWEGKEDNTYTPAPVYRANFDTATNTINKNSFTKLSGQSARKVTTEEGNYVIQIIGAPDVTGNEIKHTFEYKDSYPTENIGFSYYWAEANDYKIKAEEARKTFTVFSQFHINNVPYIPGYVKIRPVVVFPEETDRECVCQGVLCPTVFNVKGRNENAPFVQSSWIFRPNKPYIKDGDISAIINNGKQDYFKSGLWAEYRHLLPIRGISGECLQEFEGNIYDLPCNYTGEFNGISKEETPPRPIFTESFVEDFKHSFFIDRSIVTLHSPEIEFNKTLLKYNKNTKIRLIGIIPITSSISDQYVLGPSNGNFRASNIYNYNKSKWGFRQGLIFNSWEDNLSLNDRDSWKYTTSIWNHSNLWVKSDKYISAEDKRLKLSRVYNFMYSHNTNYNNINISLDLKDFKIWDTLYSTDQSLYIDHKYYQGSIDKIITGSENLIWGTESSDNLIYPGNAGNYKDESRDSINPIPITYKSNNHLVISLGTNTVNSILPEEVPNIMINNTIINPFWDKDNNVTYFEPSHNITSEYGYLFLGELYQEVNDNTRFGGTSDYAIQNNLWLPAGNAVTMGSPITWTEGDTYYQRYDHIKTMPRNEQDLNGVTSVISFMCETRINLDGRYDDRYKAVEDGLSIVPEKFNQLNEVYSQSNNFFNYRVLDTKRFGINKFPNTIVWSKTKYANSIVDNWLNINLASSLDLDSNKGKVTALKVFNDNIISFQEKCISQILFNSRVQINTSDSVPIEIANSGKVDGKRYLGNNIGCLNKHSICNSPNGLYFIDDYNKSIYLFNGEFSNLSETKGFHSWMINNSSLNVWTPEEFNNAVTYRDPINNEVLFIYKDKCLAFNEVLGEFSSFYSYENTPYMFTLNDKNIMYHKDNKNLEVKNLWVKNEGEYNYFFGDYKDFYTTVIANDNPTYDKIFSTLDFRADVLNDNNKMINSTPTVPFNYLKVVNEYQEVESNLSGKSLIPKFRVWRAQFPRLGKNRIRNTWATITLGNLDRNRKGINKKVRLHDMVVNYFI